jgi:hypothetical protein
MLVQIKFTVFGCCSAIGNFEPGDTARVSAEMAAHLVDEARCAKYVTPAVQAEQPAEPPSRGRRKGR